MGHVITGAFMKLATKHMWKEDLRLYALKEQVDGVYAQDDIPYAKGLTMDYYTPAKKEDMQNFYILDIHGGAWVYGDKKLNRHFCMHMAKRGFPVFNMNYDLIPNVNVKRQIQELFLALHKIQEQKASFGIEHCRLCLSGDSAGAHLASLAACISLDPQLQKLYGVSSKGIQMDALLLQHGIYDLEVMKHGKALYMKILYHWMFPKRESELRNHDCLCSYLNEDFPIPMFLLSSDKDVMFSAQTRQLVKRLDHFHRAYQLLYWDDTYDLNHVFHISHPDKEESQKSYDRMAEFLQQL